MKTDLANSVFLITGASGGIGSAMARQFAAKGAKLVLPRTLLYCAGLITGVHFANGEDHSGFSVRFSRLQTPFRLMARPS